MISDSERRTALYRFYDSRETLLYVGITSDPWRRWRQHMQEKPWYPQVKHQAVTWYDTEKQARKAEARAIRTESPRFNIAGAVRPPASRLLGIGLNTVITVGGAWVYLLPALMVADAYWHPLRPFVDAYAVTTPIPVIAMLLVAGSPWVRDFGCWLDRNFGATALVNASRK